MRSQAGAGMSGKEARAFQKSIRSGLAETAEAAYRVKLKAINEELARQRAECSQEAQQVREQLDEAVTAERLAVASAKRDRTKAREAEAAAKTRLRLAEENKRAKSTQKKRSCVIEADGIKSRKVAEVAHHAELRRIESWTKPRKKALSTSRERLSEKRDEVESNLSPELVPLWHKVRRTFHVPERAAGLMSLTEAFQHYAEEHPDEVIRAQEETAEKGLRRDVRRQAEEHKAEQRRKLSKDVPF